jgi:hypothetical protein
MGTVPEPQLIAVASLHSIVALSEAAVVDQVGAVVS